MRIRELAQFTHVSTSTILRFCRKFNCQGFPEFKIRLQYYLDDIKKHKEPIQKYDETVFIDFLSKSMSKDFHQNIHDACEILLKSEFLFLLEMAFHLSWLNMQRISFFIASYFFFSYY